MIDFEALSAPFAPEMISWRVGSTNADKTKGMALAFIDARDVMTRLDEVCGVGNWQCDYPHANGKTVCRIGIDVSGGDPSKVERWVWKADGAGDSDVEAEKGALSDAFKRAAVRWGIGRYLYGLPSPWVEIEQRGRSSIIKKDEYAKLEGMLEKVTSDLEWGSPAEKAAVRVLYLTVKNVVQTADDVREYRKQHAGVLTQLRKVPRQQIEELLDRITETSTAKAA